MESPEKKDISKHLFIYPFIHASIHSVPDFVVHRSKFLSQSSCTLSVGMSNGAAAMENGMDAAPQN